MKKRAKREADFMDTSDAACYYDNALPAREAVRRAENARCHSGIGRPVRT